MELSFERNPLVCRSNVIHLLVEKFHLTHRDFERFNSTVYDKSLKPLTYSNYDARRRRELPAPPQQRQVQRFLLRQFRAPLPHAPVVANDSTAFSYGTCYIDSDRCMHYSHHRGATLRQNGWSHGGDVRSHDGTHIYLTQSSMLMSHFHTLSIRARGHMDSTIMSWIMDYVSRRRMDKMIQSNLRSLPHKTHLIDAEEKNLFVVALPKDGLQGSGKISVGLRQLWTQCNTEPGQFDAWMVPLSHPSSQTCFFLATLPLPAGVPFRRVPGSRWRLPFGRRTSHQVPGRSESQGTKAITIQLRFSFCLLLPCRFVIRQRT